VAEELREKHARANEFFRRVFVSLSVMLALARLVLTYYGFTSPFSFPHHAEAHMSLGAWFFWLEAWGFATLLVCALHFLRNTPRAVYLTLLANLLLMIGVAIMGEGDWLQVMVCRFCSLLF
jgi:hypothetical protein